MVNGLYKKFVAAAILNVGIFVTYRLCVKALDEASKEGTSKMKNPNLEECIEKTNAGLKSNDVKELSDEPKKEVKKAATKKTAAKKAPAKKPVAKKVTIKKVK